MVESTTIKITNTVKDKLLALKIDNEGYSVIIANLIEENLKLKEDVEYLKEDKKNLYKLALKTSDSIALANNIHRITYFIASIVNDVSLTDEEKLQHFKTYISEMLVTNPSGVVATIDNLKDMFLIDEEEVPEIILEFEKYVRSKI